MTDQRNSLHYLDALENFRKARRKAVVENLISRLRGQSNRLLSYEEVRQRLRALETSRRELEDIPIQQIVGSVNRTTDFSRTFLPVHQSDQARWANVRAGVDGLKGLPPIEVYRIGELYFVLDGHHRVSVARDIGAATIQGYVTPVVSRVPVSASDSPDDLIIKAEYTEFLERTQIDEVRPEANLLVSAPGQYPLLAEHISVHHYFLGVERNLHVTAAEAAADWYDAVYMPVVQLIRKYDLLRAFPKRTETDLYLWIMEHREVVSHGSIGWEAPVEKVIADLQARYIAAPGKRGVRSVQKLVRTLTPAALRRGAPFGAWRGDLSMQSEDRLFGDILVTLTAGSNEKNTTLALEIARHESSRLTAIHITEPNETQDGAETNALQQEFARRCTEAGVPGRVLVERGPAAKAICRYARWVDLTIFRLAHPPPAELPSRLRSGARELIRCSWSPLLAVPEGGAKVSLHSALLALGPGRAAEEALYVAAYLASRWQIPLCVVWVANRGTAADTPTPLQHAREYLGTFRIDATYIEENEMEPETAVLLNAERWNAGFLITGSYEASPLREGVQGSTLDRILRSTRRPVLICR